VGIFDPSGIKVGTSRSPSVNVHDVHDHRNRKVNSAATSYTTTVIGRLTWRIPLHDHFSKVNLAAITYSATEVGKFTCKTFLPIGCHQKQKVNAVEL
jgi:hypothetical protein